MDKPIADHFFSPHGDFLGIVDRCLDVFSPAETSVEDTPTQFCVMVMPRSIQVGKHFGNSFKMQCPIASTFSSYILVKYINHIHILKLERSGPIGLQRINLFF